MPNQFCCKHCGCITDNPEIVPHPDKTIYYLELFTNYEKAWKQTPELGHFALMVWQFNNNRFEAELRDKYNHSITCPVCLNETRFWREAPFSMINKKEGG